MAIGFNLPNGAFRLNAQEAGGQPDYMAALMKGMEGSQKAAETVMKPQNLSEALLQAQLKNAHDRTINKYLDEQQRSEISNRDAGTGLIGQQSKYYGKNIESEMALRDAQRGLYGAQAQKAAQDYAWQKRLQETYQPFMQGGSSQNQSAVNPEYQQGGGMPPYAQNYAQNIQNIPQQQEQPQGQGQQIPLFARKALGLPEEFPQEKMNREISTSKIEAQDKQDIKRSQELIEAAKDLSLAGVDINGIHDILTGPDSLSTGITKSLTGRLGFGSEKLGELNERALRLQAQMTKAISSRGGVGAAKIVSGGKPSSWKSTSENLGITKAYAERIKNEFGLLNQEYKNISGKNLPYSLPDYVRDIEKKIDKHSFKPKINFNSAKEYHDYMRSLPPEQRRMAVKAQRGASK